MCVIFILRSTLFAGWGGGGGGGGGGGVESLYLVKYKNYLYRGVGT